jgi:hypothetical protein
MFNRIAMITLMSACIAAPLGAMAQTVGVAPPDYVVGPPLSPMDNARNIAETSGVVDIRKIEFYDDKWHVDGRDEGGHHVWMTIDPRTNSVAHLERDD